jgi:fatty acid hydroxylase family protein
MTDTAKRIDRTGAEQNRRRSISLGAAFAEFVRHPSPWTLAAVLTGGVVARLLHGDWQPSDAILPIVLVATFPLYEWVIHVFVLHWKPRRVGPLTLDSILARDHRRHHADPRDIPLIFIPWRALLWIVPATLAISVFAFGRLGLGLTYLVTASAAGLTYEWVHYLVHTDYRPVTRLYRAVWHNHRLHHYKNEHYWFTVTSSGTADRLLGTCPDPATVPRSETARNLHALAVAAGATGAHATPPP